MDSRRALTTYLVILRGLCPRCYVHDGTGACRGWVACYREWALEVSEFELGATVTCLLCGQEEPDEFLWGHSVDCLSRVQKLLPIFRPLHDSPGAA